MRLALMSIPALVFKAISEGFVLPIRMLSIRTEINERSRKHSRMSFEFLTALCTRTGLRHESRGSCEFRKPQPESSSWRLTPFGNVPCHVAGAGSPLLIVPGLWGGSAAILPLIVELAKSFRVHWFEWPGDGGYVEQAGLRNVFRPQSILEDVIKATRERDLTVIGHSFGAWVALHAITQGSLPQIGRLILTGAGLCESHRPADAFLRNLKRSKSFDANDPIIAALMKISLGSGCESNQAYRQAVASFTRTSPAALSNRMEWMTEAKAQHTSFEHSVPLTLLAAERDSVVPVHSQVRLAESIGADVTAMPGTGHLGVLTHPVQYAQAVARVMRQASDNPLRRVVSE